MSETLPIEVAVQLSAAWCAEVAAQEGIRVLFVKGIAAEGQGLRPTGRLGGDVDLLVDPADFDRFVQALADRGWLSRPQLDNRFHILQYHSVTFVHPQWPCDIDVHYYFPGLFAPEERAFDILSEGQGTVQCATAQIPTPEVYRHAVLLVVNALRSGDTAKAHDDLVRLGRLFDNDPSVWKQCLTVISGLRAGSVLLPFAEEYRLERPLPDLSAKELRAWKLWAGIGEGGITRVVYHAAHATWGERLALLRWAVWRDSRQLRNADATVHDGVLGTIRGNLDRWGRGLRQISKLWRKRTSLELQAESLSRVSVAQDPAPEFGRDVQADGLPVADITVRDGRVTVDGPQSRAGQNEPVDNVIPDLTETTKIAALECFVVDGPSGKFILPRSTEASMNQPVKLSGGAETIWTWLEEGRTTIDSLTHRVAAASGMQNADALRFVSDTVAGLLAAQVVTAQQ